MAVAKDQTAAKPRTRTAKKAAATSTAAADTAPAPTTNGTAASSAANVTKATAKPAAEPETKAEAQPEAKTEAQPEAQPEAKTTKTEAEKPVQPSQNAVEPGNRISVTIPLDSAVVGVALKAATLPVTAAKKVAQNKNGIPAYVTVGGLAVIGAVEWPVAAVGGLGLAALRRWGPLKPETDQEPKKNA